MKSTDIPWTEERVEEVARMWQRDGLSATQIAATLGAPYVTRNAVIGIIHRRKLSIIRFERPHNAPRRTTKPHTREPHRRNPKPRKVSWAIKPVGESLPPSPVVAEKVELPEPVSKRLTLIKLKSGQCKWPEGDGPFFFCGARALKVEDVFGPYCAHHEIRSHPLTDNRRHRIRVPV